MSTQPVRVERVIAGKTLVLETGQVARQAGGAVIATLGDSKVFGACTAGKARDDIDFFPLVCDYREKTEAAGKIPGGFFKREGRPTTKEILTMRLIDRSIRPMFPDGYKQEVQVMTHALAYDGSTNTDVLAMIAAFAAVRVSGVPFECSLGAVRVGQIDGEFCVWPEDEKRRDGCTLDLVVAGHKNGICMVESSAQEIKEADMITALELAHDTVLEIVDLVDELVSLGGREQQTFEAPAINQELKDKVFDYQDELTA
ncbi:MAG: polyribonucleotide nucleotidyltransferase, partial [Planctomycetota bacterium]